MALYYLMWIFVCPALRIPCVGYIIPGNLSLIRALNNWPKKNYGEEYFLTSQQVLTSQKYPTFFGTQRLIPVFTRVRLLSLSWTDQSSPRPPSLFLKIYFNIFLPSTPESSKWFFPRVFRQNPLCTSSVLHTCYWPHSCNSSGLITRIIKLLLT
jgi:hypothetical protein